MQMSKAHHQVHQAEANQKSHFVQVVGLLQVHRVSETPKLHSFSVPKVGSHLHEVVHQKQGDVSLVDDQTTCKDGGSRCRFWIALVGVLQEGLGGRLFWEVTSLRGYPLVMTNTLLLKMTHGNRCK